MGKKGRLKKDRAEMAKADRGISGASEGPSSAGGDANSSAIRTIVLPIAPSFASVLGPPFSSSASSSSSCPPSQCAAAPDRPPDFFIGVDARGDPRLIVRGSDAYEVIQEPANREASPDLCTMRDDREASPDPSCARPLNSSPPPSPPSTSMPSGSASSSSSVSKGSKKQAAGGSSSSSGDGSSSSKKGSGSGGQSSPGRRS